MLLRILPYDELGVLYIPDFLWSVLGSAKARKFGVSRSFFARCGIPLHCDWYPSRW
jgi:hypothetical protein